MSNKKIRIIVVINITLSLILGTAIYVFLRSGTYINDFITKLYTVPSFSKCNNALIDFFRYHLVDALWEYAFVFSMAAVFVPKGKQLLILFFAAGLFGFVWEFLQLIHFVTGTFDPLDIVSYIAADLIAVSILLFLNKRKEKIKWKNY